MTKIDVIIPVYNTPKKDLDLCFESILNQTLPDWRLCVIDDGSKEETASYLDEWKERDQRIEVYHFENGGPPVARNRGLELIRAPYFMLVDSDDILLEDFMDHSYKVSMDNDLDLMIGSIDRIYDNGEHIEYKTPQFGGGIETKVYTGDEVNSLLDYAIATNSHEGNQELSGAWLARLYPKLINAATFKKYNIQFENSMFNHDDNIFSFDCMLNFERVGLTKHVYYKYIEHSYSIVHRKASKKIYNEEIEYIKTLKAREERFTEAGCSAALANRYLSLTSGTLGIASICDDVRKAYDEINDLIGIDRIVGMIEEGRYPLHGKTKIVYQLLKIRNGKIRKNVICNSFSLYRTFRRIMGK